MILEAGELDCAAEVIPIVAALSIQDPRERPAEQRAQADQQHARFADETLRLPRLPQPLALPARAAARAVGQPVPQALQGRVPALPARARVAGPRRRAAALGEGARASRSTSSPPSRPPCTARCSPACSRTSASRTPQGREYLGARGARFAIFPGSGAGAEAARVGDGRRAGRDVAAVGPRRRADRPEVGRAARRAPRLAHLLRAALGREPRLRRGDGAGDALRAADRRPAARSQYGRIDPVLSRELFIRRALVEGEWETRHDVLGRQPGAAGGGRRARAARPPARPARLRRGAVRASTTSGSRPTSSPARTSTAGGATRAAPTPTCSPTRASCSSPTTAARRATPGRPSEWKQGDARAARSPTASSPAPSTTA